MNYDMNKWGSVEARHLILQGSYEPVNTEYETFKFTRYVATSDYHLSVRTPCFIIPQ